MARGWHYTKLSLSSALLFFVGMCFVFKEKSERALDVLKISQGEKCQMCHCFFLFVVFKEKFECT